MHDSVAVNGHWGELGTTWVGISYLQPRAHGRGGEDMVFLLAPNLWLDEKRVSVEENREMELTFTSEKLDEVLASMKPDSAPGPDGLPVALFKKFCEILKAPF
jgi:hypothetical protein